MDTNEMNKEGLKELKRQLEVVKQQDKLLENIEIRLHKMRDIAQYATDNQLSKKESDKLNQQMEEQQSAIDELKALYHRVSFKLMN